MAKIAGAGVLRRVLGVGLGLSVSGAALATLVYMERDPVRAEVMLEADDGVARHTNPSAPPATRKQVALAALAAATNAAPSASTATAPRLAEREVAPALVAPDLVGEKLSLARRRARTLGLRVSARDEYGQRVTPEVAHFYRVRRQSIEPGSTVAPGSTLEVRVREIASLAMGY